MTLRKSVLKRLALLLIIMVALLVAHWWIFPAQRNLGRVLIVWGVCGVFVGGGILVLLEKSIFSHVTRLNQQIEAIRTCDDLSMRIAVGGADEVASLTTAINHLLIRVADLQQEHIRTAERYRTLVDNAPLGILSIDLQGNVQDSNPMLVAMLGSPSDEALRALNVFTSSSLLDSGMAEDFKHCLEAGRPEISERRFSTLWGKEVYLRAHLSPLRDNRQQLIGAQAIIEDLTERVLVEQALNERETEYRSLFKNMRSGFAYQKIVVDAQEQPIDAIFLEVNEAFEQLTGLKQVVGKRATEVLPAIREIQPDLIALYGKVALTGEKASCEAYFQMLGVWFAISVYSPERGYFVTVFDDITERKWAEKSLRDLNEELEQRVAARTLELKKTNQFLSESLETVEQAQKELIESEKMAALGGLVAGVTHEINTPLGIGITAASYLEQLTQTTSAKYQAGQMTRTELEHYLDAVRESAAMILGNLSRAADHVKSFKQIAVDQTHDTKRDFSLKQCIDNVLFSLRPKLRTTQHTVTVECSELLHIESYPGAFSQILTNFVMNSLIHGFEHQPQGQITIRAWEEADILHLLYCDNGRGMSEQEQSCIFEPFYTTKREQGGTGLGLHIVYNLVTQTLNGQILCNSAPGAGTTFTLLIPMASEGERMV